MPRNYIILNDFEIGTYKASLILHFVNRQVFELSFEIEDKCEDPIKPGANHCSLTINLKMAIS